MKPTITAVALDHDIGCEQRRPDAACMSTPIITPPSLRPYQTDVVAEIEKALAAGQRRLLLVAPTGSGKTVVFCEIIKRYVEQHKTVLVLAHRREIISQTSDKLRANGISHGIIQAGIDPRPMASVQVASVQTLWMRAMRSQAMALPPADLLVVDECHHATAMTWRKIIESYPDAVLLGTTATPCRGDGRGLGGIFEMMIQCPQVASLIEQGHLVRSRVYAPVDPNLKGVRTVAGDYVESQLAERMDRAKIIGDIVTHWHKFGERRKTVVFAVNVAHSIHLRNEFVRSGVRAEHIDGSTPKEERDAALARLASGDTDVIVNCMVLTEGFDCPDIGCIILARPTKKMGLYRQMIGRGLRPANGKTDAIILDHSGAVFQHGLPEDHVEWTLDPDRRAVAPAHHARLDHKVRSLVECTQCSALRMGGKPCPHCGFMPRRPGQYVTIREGNLGLVESGKAKAPIYDAATLERWHSMLAAIASERGYKPGWTAHKYREKFGSFPTWGSKPEPIEPSPEVLSWVRSRQIAYAKALERGVV
jgi:DNA repair protein RadD